MAWLLVSFALSRQPAPAAALDPWHQPLRLVTDDDLRHPIHVGLRPAAFLDDEDHGALEGGFGLTLQITR